MTLEEAKRILHPETSKSALFGYDREQGVALVEEACLVACDAIDKLIKLEEYVDDMR